MKFNDTIVFMDFLFRRNGFLLFRKNMYQKAFSWFQAGITDPPEMSPALIAEKEKQRKFLEQLMDGSKLEGYNIVVPVKAELRKYQQVRWSDNTNVENIFICWFLCEIYVLYYDIYFVYDHRYNNSEKI